MANSGLWRDLATTGHQIILYLAIQDHFDKHVAGLLTSLVNVYTARGGDWSIMAMASVTITGMSTAVTAGLFSLYNFQKLRKVRQEHERRVKEQSREKSEE
ncbi:conserved hypothetical protein [Histoplasma capsulatum H143]|uniref:Uncharacterized protein n=1 Tax=Ajellomyces capsulatus (strain H143) TaxID=544712 RepID=C6HDV4_AJECH|nr:conserved hypothetical protein [Histoplasma capsulatum H143]